MKNLLLLFCSLIIIACDNTSSKEKLLIEYMVPELKEGVFYRSHKLNPYFTFIFKNELKKIDDRNWVLEIIYMNKDSVPFQISKERYCGTDSIVNEYLAEIRIENGVAKEYKLVDISNYSSNFKPEELTKVVRLVKYSDKTSEIHSQVSIVWLPLNLLLRPRNQTTVTTHPCRPSRPLRPSVRVCPFGSDSQKVATFRKRVLSPKTASLLQLGMPGLWASLWPRHL